MTNYQEFHDGFFEGLWIPEKGTVYVYLSTPTGERATVVITGLVMLKVTGVKEGNVILDVSSRYRDEITLADISELYDLESTHDPADWEHRLLKRARQENFVLFEINPSYGGSFLALAQTAHFKEGRK